MVKDHKVQNNPVLEKANPFCLWHPEIKKCTKRYTEVETMDEVKVLMVDDEARMRKLVKDFLAIKG